MGAALVCFVFLGLFGLKFGAAEEYVSSEKWLYLMDYFNKTFPNNDELKIARILTKAENYPILKRAFKQNGTSDQGFTKFLEALQNVNLTLYSELKGPSERQLAAYERLDEEEQKPIHELLFEGYVRKSMYFFDTGRISFWHPDEAYGWVGNYDVLNQEKKARIRSAFPFLVWLTEYWEELVLDADELPERKLLNMIGKMVETGLLKRVIDRADGSFDYHKLMNVLKAEKLTNDEQSQMFEMKFGKLYETLGEKEKALLFILLDVLKVENLTVYDHIEPIASSLRKAYEGLSEKPKTFLRMRLEWLFENLKRHLPEYDFKNYPKGAKGLSWLLRTMTHFAETHDKDGPGGNEARDVEVLKLYNDLTKEELQSLRTAFPLQLGVIQAIWGFYRLDIHPK